jgi:hypothetical protein
VGRDKGHGRAVASRCGIRHLANICKTRELPSNSLDVPNVMHGDPDVRPSID